MRRMRGGERPGEEAEGSPAREARPRPVASAVCGAGRLFRPAATPARYRSIIERVHAPPGSAVAGTHEAAPAAHDVEKAV